MLTDTALKGMEKRKLWKNENVSADIPVGYFFFLVPSRNLPGGLQGRRTLKLMLKSVL